MTTPRAVIELPTLPSMGSQLLRALVTRRSGHKDALPQVRVRVQRVRPPAEQLGRYRQVCGFRADGFLPLTHPQVLAGPLHATLLGRPDFPFPILGLIHVRNLIQQVRPVPEDAELSLTAWLAARREVAAGVELELMTEVELGGAVVWGAQTTMLRRGPVKREGGGTPRGSDAEAERFAASRMATWTVPPDTGRRYARASGDYNPIHLTALTARPFGFPRAIAHGMWTLARCVAELGEAAPRDALSLACEFRRPLLLPTQVTFQSLQTGRGADFRVASPEGKLHLVGSLESASGR